MDEEADGGGGGGEGGSGKGENMTRLLKNSPVEWDIMTGEEVGSEPSGPLAAFTAMVGISGGGRVGSGGIMISGGIGRLGWIVRF